MNTLVDKLKNIPVALSGLALGVAGLGNLLASEVYVGFRYMLGFAAFMLLVMVIAKKIAHPRVLLAEMLHPVAGSFVPTFAMAFMVIGNIVAHDFLLLGQIIWYSAISLHVIFASVFIYQRLRSFALEDVLPSWFIPPVGIVVACVTYEPMHAQLLAEIIFYWGFITYLMLLPLVLYRLIFAQPIEDAKLPSFAVMAAPASLCLSGYLTVFTHHAQPFIVHLLFTLALMMTSLVLLAMIRINHLRIRFMPIYASFTFPLVIGATGLIKYARYLGMTSADALFWYHLGVVELVLACIVVSWVFSMMLLFVSKHVFMLDDSTR